MRSAISFILCTVLTLPALAKAPLPPGALPAAPVAPVRPHQTVIHGDKLEDNYYWLRDKGSPEVSSYLHKERDYADAYMKHTAPLQTTLYNELVSRVAEDDATAPYREGSHLYWSRYEKGKQYRSFWRRPLVVATSGPGRGAMPKEQLLLDLNVLGASEKFIALGGSAVTDDEQRLAYLIDTEGSGEYTLQVKELGTGALLAERFDKVNSMAWSADGKTLFYVVDDAAKRPYRLYRHVLGSKADTDTLVYEEKDERFILDVARTRSRKWLVLSSNSHTQSELRVLRASEPGAAWRVVAPRAPERQYWLDHRGDLFYILVNDTGRNNRLVTAPVDDPQPARWHEVVAHRDTVMLEQASLFANWLVLSEREDGLPQLRVTDLRSGQTHRIAMTEPVYDVSLGDNAVFDSDVLRYVFQSPVTPPSTFDYDMGQRKGTLVRRAPTPNYDASRYRTESAQVTVTGGVRVPVSLLYPADFKRDGTRPLLLLGYGSYGISNTADFDRNLFSLVDRGMVVALAHIRGGGELGKKWHDAGRMRNKKNTFTDFIAVAEFLIKEKYAAKDRLAAEGGSAGGLLMGAVVNMRPELFKAVLAYVPFVDVITTMLDEQLPLTVGEFEEWGNPKLKEDYLYMKSYSPYDNVAHKAYPAMLVVSSINDGSVMYWEPAKWVAKLRSYKTDHNPLLFRINLDPAGHGGKAGRYEKLHDKAFDFAFLLEQLGIQK